LIDKNGKSIKPSYYDVMRFEQENVDMACKALVKGDWAILHSLAIPAWIESEP
jgi:hypothetical protein